MRCTENIGDFPVTGHRMGEGRWRVEWWRADGKVVSEIWDAEPPDVGLVLQPSGVLVYVDNHGVVCDIIGAHALVSVRAVP
jgi:hypothetical protein